MRGKGNAMYQKYSQYSELPRLIGAAAVSKRFRQTLLRNPEQILEGGYLGYHFGLTAEEAALVKRATVGDIQGFSLQVWEWMGRNGHGNESAMEPPQSAQPFEDVFAGIPVPTVPVSIKEEEKPARRLFTSKSTSTSWNGRMAMDPLILVVDDNREMAEGLRFALEMEGFRVALASDGERAVKLLEHEHPDLILADIKMPRMDGYALLRVVKENAEWRDIPFVFVTAAADWREAVRAKSMGAEEYIIKPFELEDLMEVVRQLTVEVERVEVRTTGEKGEMGL